MKYYIVDTKFHEDHSEKISGPNIIGIYKILKGQYKGQFACPQNSIKDFPDLFKGKKFELVELSDSDFEPDYDSLELTVDSKYKVLKKEENYLDKEVKITYVQDGKILETTQKITNETLTKTGYSIDMEEKVREEELKKRENLEPIEPIKIDLKNK